MRIKNVDFGNGISPKIINDNFGLLQESIFNERLETFGTGISNGLNVTQNKFELSFSSGSIINKDGEKIDIEAHTVILNLPKLKEITKEIVLGVDSASFELPHCLYDISRLHSATVYSNAISIKLKSNISINVKPTLIEANFNTGATTIKVNESYKGQTLLVTYQVPQLRLDTIYVDTNYEIKVAESIGSNTSPSAYLNIENCEQILYVYKIDPYYELINGVCYASAVKSSQYCYLRNIYTNKDGELYIKGTKFDDLQIIHYIKPDPAYLNAVYYDEQTNRLKIYREINGVRDWYTVNDDSVINVLEKKLWLPEDNPVDRKIFIFEGNEINMRFIPGKNELDVMIEQYPLHSHQYTELTLANAIASGLSELLIQKGYALDEISTDYENTGIGFCLSSRLADATYVEARVCHRIKETGSHERFQRSATFVDENDFLISCDNLKNNVVSLTGYFRYGEHQLEFFKEGRKLILGTDFIEGETNNSLVKGNLINKITILIPWSEEAHVSYRITSNVYSYDHVSELFSPVADEFFKTASGINDKIGELEETISTLVSLEENYKQALNQMEILQKTVENSLKYNGKDIFYSFAAGVSNQTVTLTSFKLSDQDMLMVFDQNGKHLSKDMDYVLSINGLVPTLSQISSYVTKIQGYIIRFNVTNN